MSGRHTCCWSILKRVRKTYCLRAVNAFVPAQERLHHKTHHKSQLKMGDFWTQAMVFCYWIPDWNTVKQQVRLQLHLLLYWPFWRGLTGHPLEAQGGPYCSCNPSYHFGPVPSQPHRPPGVLPHHRNSWFNNLRTSNFQTVPGLRRRAHE